VKAVGRRGIQDHERHRTTAQQTGGWLGAPIEEQLDRITRTASRLFDVAAAQLCRIDAAWWQLSPDLHLFTPCALGESLIGGLHHPAVREVRDLEVSAGFSARPSVSGPGAVRSGAAVPLFSHTGVRLGSFCLLGAAPRAPMTPGEQAAFLDQAAELLSIATRDPLTGLPNRRSFEDAFECAVGAGEPFGLMLPDLDELKQLNDTEGATPRETACCPASPKPSRPDSAPRARSTGGAATNS
jgi:Diguanylate cyclase, GGDEF domain